MSTDHAASEPTTAVHAPPASGAPGGATAAPVPAPRIDPRPRWRRMVGPVATAVGVGLATLYVAFNDPNEPGHFPGCPTQTLLGVDCPGCGGLRATFALTRGDVGGAADHNLLFVLMIPLIAVSWLMWVRRAWTGVQPALTPARLRWIQITPLIVIGIAVVYTVARNLLPFLGSGIG